MSPRRTIPTAVAWLLGMLLCQVANAYPVGRALPLDTLVEKADFICKAVAVTSKPVEDAWFTKHRGFDAVATELKIIAVYKGAKLTRASFRHYAPHKEGPSFYSPQHYEFAAGRTYLVFAAKTDDDKVFRQIRKDHTLQEDQGVLLAADDSPHPGKSLREIYWLELTGLLNGEKVADVKYAINHLNRMSNGLRWDESSEFPREAVLKVVLPLLSRTEPGIVEQAILAIGTNNALMDQGNAAGWLATIGKGHIPGYAHGDVKQTNLGGQRYWNELSKVADTSADPRVRALAIRALGRANQPEIRPLALRWVRDREPRVAQSALVLLTDYLNEADHDLLKSLAEDPRELVRTGVATAIGYGQVQPLVPVLGKMLGDTSDHVSSAAALSLLSFSLDASEVILKANVKHANYGPLFVNALAQSHGLRYADELCDIIQHNRQPKNWWGGFVVWGDSWNVLFKAAQDATKEELAGKRFEKVLAALEAPASGDPKSPTFYSSSEPRDLYALYRQKGMTDRAQAFRTQCKKTISYDIDYYFKMVDEKPDLYTRDRR